MTTRYLFPIEPTVGTQPIPKDSEDVLPHLSKTSSGSRKGLPPIHSGLSGAGKRRSGDAVQPAPGWNPGIGLPTGDPATSFGLASYKHYDVQLDWCEVRIPVSL